MGGENSFDTCKTRQVNKCEDAVEGTRRYENWHCIELEGNGLAQISVSRKNVEQTQRGYQACLAVNSLDHCKTRQVNICENFAEGSRKYENWQCIDLEGNGLA